MDVLIAAMTLWLSLNFGLTPHDEQPRIALVPPIEVAFLRYQAFTAEAQRQVLAMYAKAENDEQRREVVSVYNPRNRTIYLPEKWTGRTAAELSVLVHELVHHLQELSGERFECPAKREVVAYEAQEKWLNLFGRDLQSEFHIDPMTLKVSTSCGF